MLRVCRLISLLGCSQPACRIRNDVRTPKPRVFSKLRVLLSYALASLRFALLLLFLRLPQPLGFQRFMLRDPVPRLGSLPSVLLLPNHAPIAHSLDSPSHVVPPEASLVEVAVSSSRGASSVIDISMSPTREEVLIQRSDYLPSRFTASAPDVALALAADIRES